MVDAAVSNYKLINKIKDDTFNVDLISNYNLSLQINPDLFRICVTDSVKNRCLLLEDYSLNSSLDSDKILGQLQEIFEEHHILKAGFWKSVKLGFKTFNFVLVPNSLFDKEYGKDYLNLNGTIKSESCEEVQFYHQHSGDLVNIFSADKNLIEWFRLAYPAKPIKIFHHTSSFIEGLFLNRNHKEDKSMFLYVESNLITIVIAKSKSLEFCNSFAFTTPDDFIYYVMFVIDQLKFNVELNTVTVWGDLLPDSPMYKKLFKYIRNVSFGTKPGSIYFGYNFDEIFDHNYFDLYSMHLCE